MFLIAVTMDRKVSTHNGVKLIFDSRVNAVTDEANFGNQGRCALWHYKSRPHGGRHTAIVVTRFCV